MTVRRMPIQIRRHSAGGVLTPGDYTVEYEGHRQYDIRKVANTPDERRDVQSDCYHKKRQPGLQRGGRREL